VPTPSVLPILLSAFGREAEMATGRTRVKSVENDPIAIFLLLVHRMFEKYQDTVNAAVTATALELAI
jgi:hypothetical protein